MSTSLITIEHLKKNYGRKSVLTDISIEITKGECIGILGSNGCGKSTLLSILAGIQKPNSGLITIDGQNPLQKHSLFSDYIGYVPQENPLMEQLTVLDNLRFWYADTNRNVSDDLKEGIPHMLGLKDIAAIPVYKLSGGMKKRLSIACALAKQPPILILDEPGASLDMICKEDIKSYLKHYLNNNGTVIITSHEEAELSITSRCLLLKQGSLTPITSPFTAASLVRMMKE